MYSAAAVVPAFTDALALATHRAVFAWRLPHEARRLRRLSTPTSLALAAALTAHAQDAADAVTWTARIEALRTALLRDEAVVSFRDYGTGAGGATARPATRRVCDLCRAAVPPHEGMLLYRLVRRLRPMRCLELGTCLGLSAAYLAAALTKNGDGGRLFTLEGGAALADLATMHLRGLGLTNTEVVTGRFQDSLAGILQAHAPFDFVFFDGHHDPEATQAYVEQIRPALAPGAVLVFDDIAWSPGMRRLWHTLAADAALHPTADLFTVGIACIA